MHQPQRTGEWDNEDQARSGLLGWPAWGRGVLSRGRLLFQMCVGENQVGPDDEGLVECFLSSLLIFHLFVLV